MKKIPVAISSCLLGNKVRFDGGHKQSKYCLDTLNDWFEYQPICPEMGIGMPAPRPPIRLINDEGDIRVVQVDDQAFDVTDDLKAYAKNKLHDLDDICGYIVIRNSPSCGMERVKVYHKNGNPAGKSDRGVYIKEIMKNRPELPIEEEGRLQDVTLRENFISRVFAYQDFKASVKERSSVDALVKFHSRYKYLVMAHNYADYKKLGQLVANNDGLQLSELIEKYELALMQCLKKIANPKSHSNVLYHILGYLKDDLQSEAKKELVNVIEQYRNGSLTLIAPVTLLNHYIKQYGNDYIAQQAYLNPHPIELGLRNYI